MKILIPILLYCSVIYGHSHSHSHSHSQNIVERLSSRLNNVSFTQTTKTTKNEKFGYFLYKGKKIQFQNSQMLLLITDLLRELRDEIDINEEHIIDEVEIKLKKQFLKRIISLPIKPIKFVAKTLKSIPGKSIELMGSTIRVSKAHGTTALTVIVITQFVWEIIESAVSISIGAGGSHAYCTIFNLALLKFVSFFEINLGIFLDFQSSVPIHKRFTAALKNINWNEHRQKSVLNKYTRNLEGHNFPIRKKDFKNIYWNKVKNLNNFESTLFSNNLYSAIYISQLPNNKISYDIYKDIEFMISDAPIVEKHFTMLNHINGINLLMTNMTHQVTHLKNEKKIRIKEYFEINSSIGRLEKDIRRYHQRLALNVNLKNIENKNELKNDLENYLNAITEQSNQIIKTYKEIVSNEQKLKNIKLGLYKTSCLNSLKKVVK